MKCLTKWPEQWKREDEERKVNVAKTREGGEIKVLGYKCVKVAIVLLALSQLLLWLRRSLSLVRLILSSLHLLSLLALLSILSICVYLHFFFFSMLHFYPSLTHSLSNQGSCDPYNPVIMGPVLLSFSHSCFRPIPSCSLCQRALQNLQILFSLDFYACPCIPQCATSPSLPVFFSSEGILILIILSPLAHLSFPLQVCPSTISLTLSLSAWSTLGESNSLIISPQHHSLSTFHPFITLTITLYSVMFNCECVCGTVRQM